MRIRTFLYESHDECPSYSTLICTARKNDGDDTLGVITSCFTSGEVGGNIYGLNTTIHVPRTDKTYLISIRNRKVVVEDLELLDARDRDWRRITRAAGGESIQLPDLRFIHLRRYLKVLFNTLPISVLSIGDYSSPKLIISHDYDVPPVRLVEVELLDEEGDLLPYPRMIGPISLLGKWLSPCETRAIPWGCPV